MKAKKFKHSNVVFAEDQPQYTPLPALKLDTNEGEVITCWKISAKDRFKILFTGCVWLSLMTFNQPLTPSFLSANRKDVYSHVDDNKSLFSKLIKSIKRFK